MDDSRKLESLVFSVAGVEYRQVFYDTESGISWIMHPAGDQITFSDNRRKYNSNAFQIRIGQISSENFSLEARGTWDGMDLNKMMQKFVEEKGKSNPEIYQMNGVIVLDHRFSKEVSPGENAYRLYTSNVRTRKVFRLAKRQKTIRYVRRIKFELCSYELPKRMIFELIVGPVLNRDAIVQPSLVNPSGIIDL